LLSPKKIVQVCCNELMQQLLLLLWGWWVVLRNVLGCGCWSSAWGGYKVLWIFIYLFNSRFHVLLLLIGVFVPAIFIYLFIYLFVM
jgi:hypothetical protein